MMKAFNKFLDNEFSLEEFEKWIYNTPKIEQIIGEENYQFLIAFNYDKKNAELEIQNFILSNLVSEEDFSNWKVNKILEESKIKIPTENLYSYAKHNPNFLAYRTLKFQQFWTKKKIEINWTNKVSKFKRGNEIFLNLGTFADSYIYILVNNKNEIWFENDIGGKQYFGGKSIKDALTKLLIRMYHE